MDPLSHAIVGRLLIGVDPRRRAGVGAGVAAVLGALAPDLDAVFMPIGWDLYLRVHQIWTHTFVGTMACAGLVTGVLRLMVYVAQIFRSAGRTGRPEGLRYVRWGVLSQRTPRPGASRDGRWTPLALAAWVGALSHIGLDVLSGATVRPWWPVSDAVVRYGLVGMAEPSIVAMLVVAAIVFWRWPARRVNVAATCLVLLIVLFAGKALMHAEAERLYQSATARDAVEAHFVDAEWGTLSRWVVIDRTADRVRRWHVDTSRSTVAREIGVPRVDVAPNVAAASKADVAQNFLAAHDYPFAVTTREGEEAIVRWSDLQYCWTPTGPGAARSLVGSPVRPADLPIACGLWFGVALDSQGAIARQFVTIGEWEQTR